MRFVTISDEKMSKKSVVFFVFMSILLQGCTSTQKKDSAFFKKNGVQNVQPSQAIALQQCIYDADTLVKLNKTFQKDTSQLYALITDAKFYASVAGQTSANVKTTITPLFEYKINDYCNRISQKLIKEFENRAKKDDFIAGIDK